MKAAEYHYVMSLAKQAYECAKYVDNTQRMMQEQSDAIATMRTAWITSAPPLPGTRYEGDEKRWKPLL